MQLGIVSDTHDNTEVVERAVGILTDVDPDAIVHCGDFVAPFSAAAFDVGIEFHAVRGNNDGEWALGDTVSDFGTYHGEFADLSFGGHDVAVYHGTSEALVDALVASGTYDYVLHGHTHEFVHEERGGTVRINPGGIAIDGAPDPPSVVVLDVDSGDVDRRELR